MTSEDTQTVSQKVVKVLLVSPFDEDHRQLQAILRHSKWQQYGARTRAAALELLRQNPVPVVVCESDLPDGSWKELLTQLNGLPHAPMLVVTSRFADELLWSEALNLGAYNVLAKPLHSAEVFHVVSLAWLMWKTNSEHTQPLARTA